MDNNIEIGKRIKARREELNMTQEELGNPLGFNKSTIQRYENGKVKNIKLPVLESIALQLKVNPAWLALKSDIKFIENTANPTPAKDSRSEVYEDLNKLSDSDLIKVEGFIKGLLAQDSSDK